MERPENEPKPIKVIDRRRFDEDGTPREGVEDPVADVPAPAPQAQPTPAAPRPAVAMPPRAASPTPPANESEPSAAAPRPPRAGGRSPGLDFSHFCLSLANSAQIAMGLVPNPATRMIAKDMASAQQTIEILGMLQQKTAGNLTPEETQIVTEILYALRMQFVELTKGPAASAMPKI